MLEAGQKSLANKQVMALYILNQQPLLVRYIITFIGESKGTKNPNICPDQSHIFLFCQKAALFVRAAVVKKNELDNERI